MGGADVPFATALPLDAVQLVEVTAPATLDAGYSFPAVYNGTTFSVTVPTGGVKAGQKMMIPFQPSVSEITPLVTSGDTAPHGSWKDGLCDCCTLGLCHPSLLNAYCFPQILMAQVLTRLKLDMFANEAPEAEWRMTFKRILILIVFYFIFTSIFSCPADEVEVGEDGNITVIESSCPTWQRSLSSVVTTAFFFYTLIVLVKTRGAVRARYEIPEKNCVGMEDCCCAFWCGCCTVAQLARQTADYDQKRAVCCSDTGLPPALAPAFIV